MAYELTTAWRSLQVEGKRMIEQERDRLYKEKKFYDAHVGTIENMEQGVGAQVNLLPSPRYHTLHPSLLYRTPLYRTLHPSPRYHTSCCL